MDDNNNCTVKRKSTAKTSPSSSSGKPANPTLKHDTTNQRSKFSQTRNPNKSKNPEVQKSTKVRNNQKSQHVDSCKPNSALKQNNIQPNPCNKYQPTNSYRPVYSCQNISGNAYQNMPANSYQNVPGSSYQIMPGSSYQNMPGSSYQNMPGSSYQNMPGSSYQNMPGSSYQNMPGSSYQNMPGSSYQNMPTNSYQSMPGSPYHYMFGSPYKNLLGNLYHNVQGHSYQSMSGNPDQNVLGNPYQNKLGNSYLNMQANPYQSMLSNTYLNMPSNFSLNIPIYFLKNMPSIPFQAQNPINYQQSMINRQYISYHVMNYLSAYYQSNPCGNAGFGVPQPNYPFNFGNPTNDQGNFAAPEISAGEDLTCPRQLAANSPLSTISSHGQGATGWSTQTTGGNPEYLVNYTNRRPNEEIQTLSPHGVEFLYYKWPLPDEKITVSGTIEPVSSGSSVNQSPSKEEDDDADKSESSSPIASSSTESSSIGRNPFSTPFGLDIEDPEVYKLLLMFVPPVEDQKHLGFPVACSLDPSQAIVFNKAYERSCRKLMRTCNEKAFMQVMKICTRCGTPFNSLYPNLAENTDFCHYHWGKQEFMPNYQGYMTCCARSPDSPGCTLAKFHVWDGLPNHEVAILDNFVSPELCSQSKKVYGLDCETCYTTAGTELVRVALVSITGQKLYDSVVLPNNSILDFNTRFSGIRVEDYFNYQAKSLFKVQEDLLNILEKDSIIVGHGLENDLRALKMIHPLIVDTSIIYPHEHGFPYRRSLKSLAQEVLHKRIQGDYGHNPVEDAWVCIQLALIKLKTNFQVILTSKGDWKQNENGGKKNRGKKGWKKLTFEKEK